MAERRKPWVLTSMALAFAMTMIDATIVAVALPTIQRDLDMTNTGRVWVVNAYLLVYTASIAAAGKFADRLGQRRVFMAGLAVFVGASVAAGGAPNGALLIAARAVEGLGGALMTPTSQAMVTDAFPEDARGRALGTYAGVAAVGVAVGPLLGGTLTSFADWRWIFLVNVPIGVVVLALTRYADPAQVRDAAAPPVDWVGLGALVTGMTAFVVAVMQSDTWGLGSPGFLGLLAVGVALLGFFGRAQLRARFPLLELRIFRDRDFLSDNVVMFCVRFALFGMSVYMPVFIQDVMGFSPFEAGAATLPTTIALFLTSPRAGRAYDRLGARALMGWGSLITAVGFVWLALVLPEQSYAWMVPAFVLGGLGVGLTQTPALTDAMNVAPDEQHGEAAGVLGTVQQLGGTIGVAVLTAVLTPLFVDRLAAETGASGTEVQTALTTTRGGSEPAGIPPPVVTEAKDAFADALATAFLVVVGMLVVACVAALVLHSRGRRPGGARPPPGHAVAG